MAQKKYEFLPVEEMTFQDKKIQVQRIRALIDIPFHNVKAGDVGGYISAFGKRRKNARMLNDEGNCWIGGDAIVFGFIYICDDVLVTDKATVFSYSSKIKKLTDLFFFPTSISGKTVIKDNSTVNLYYGSSVKGNSLISGSARLKTNLLEADVNSTIISDNAVVSSRKPLTSCKFGGNVEIVNPIDSLNNINLSTGKYVDYSRSTFHSMFLMEERTSLSENQITIEATNSETKINSAKNNFLLNRLQGITDEFKKYQDDIVMIIKYPAMSDMKDKDTLAFASMLKKVQWAVDQEGYVDDEFEQALDALDHLFIIAESNAHATVDTTLLPQQKAKLKTAKQMLAIATDENANENERKISCERVLKEIKGFRPLGDVLVENLRISAGLKELEA